MDKSLQARFFSHVEKTPDRRAIAFYNDRGEYAWYSYEQFHRRAAGYAGQLAERGLGRGDVCIMVLPSEEFCATLLLAVLQLGAVPLLIAPPVIQGRGAYSSLGQIVQRMVGKTKPRLVVCAESMASMRAEFENGRAGARFLFGESELAPATADTVAPVAPAGSDVAALQLTSGTTGFPRVCVWKQQNVLAALDGMAGAMKLAGDDVCLNWTPLYHDMGLVNNFFLCMAHGVPLVMLRPNDFVMKPALWLRSLSDVGATTTWSPNFGFALAAQRVRDREIEGVRLEGVRAFWNAAERIHLETMRAFHNRFADYGVRFEALKTNFGCAENVGGATFSDPAGAFLFERVDRATLQAKRIAQPAAESQDEKQTVPVVGCGRPYPGMRIKILSPTGEPLPDGHVGEVGLETPSRMDGYLGDARATNRALFNGLVRTGDLGYMRDGELFWVGRVKERITLRGKKLDPSDFEPILLQVPGLRQGCFAAFGVDDWAQGTQRVVIVAEVRESAARTPEELVRDIRNQTFQFLGINVSDVLLVKPGTLTKTSSGKRRHRYFRELYLEGKLNEFEWIPNGNGVGK